MSKRTFVSSDTGVVVEEVIPPFNLWSGRDTSRFALVCPEPSLTQQEFAGDADINVIMARYVKTGTVPVYADRQPFYVDADGLPSFMDMQNILISAEASFMSLPAHVRREFDNDPSKFVEFASDEKNRDKLREWDMLSPEAVQRLDAAKAAEAAKAADLASAAAKPPGKGPEKDPVTQ